MWNGLSNFYLMNTIESVSVKAGCNLDLFQGTDFNVNESRFLSCKPKSVAGAKFGAFNSSDDRSPTRQHARTPLHEALPQQCGLLTLLLHVEPIACA